MFLLLNVWIYKNKLINWLAVYDCIFQFSAVPCVSFCVCKENSFLSLTTVDMLFSEVKILPFSVRFILLFLVNLSTI